MPQAPNAIIVTGKAGNGQQLTAQRINAIGGITFQANGTVLINGAAIDISAATVVTCAVTAGQASGAAPPSFVFTIS